LLLANTAVLLTTNTVIKNITTKITTRSNTYWTIRTLPYHTTSMSTPPLSIIVASHNPVKLATVQRAYQEFLPHLTITLQGVSAASDVPEQPMTDQQTLQWAKNRAHNARLLMPDADARIGIEW